MADSLQAATAGVQDYQRVRVGSASSARITDAAAADVIHLLTELVDNALPYSPPTTTVSLGSTTAPDGVTIEVADAGLGIPDETLAAINETLRSGGDVTPDTRPPDGSVRGEPTRPEARHHGVAAAQPDRAARRPRCSSRSSVLRDPQQPEVPELHQPSTVRDRHGAEAPMPARDAGASPPGPRPRRRSTRPLGLPAA